MPVWAAARGRTVGVFDTWRACEDSVKGFSRALYKKFAGRAEATAWLDEHAGPQATEAGAAPATGAQAPATAAPDGTQQSEELIAGTLRARLDRPNMVYIIYKDEPIYTSGRPSGGVPVGFPRRRAAARRRRL